MATVTDIYDPALYVDGPIHEIFAELRRTDPVHWQPMPDEPGYWVVLKHADLCEVARNPLLYSAETLGVILEDPAPEQLENTRNMLLMMDPPRHTAYRRPLVESFKARVIAQMEDRIRTVCKEIMRTAAEQRDVEFVHDVAGMLPNQVIGELFGIPADDWADIRLWAEQSTSSQDPELAADDYANIDLSAMVRYAIALAAQRRAEPPREDLTSLILDGDFGGRPMTDVEFGTFFNQLVVAGNDTTRGMLSGGLQLLLQHPDQMEELRRDRWCRARWRRSCATPIRSTTSGAPPPPTPSCAASRSRRATRSRCGTRRPTATKTCSPIRNGSTSTASRTRTCRSGSRSTSASACTWPGSKARSSSRSC